MSANTYFPTEEARKAKNWDMLQQFQEGRASVARMENEMKAKLSGFAKIGRCSSDPRCSEFVSDGRMVAVLRQDIKNPAVKNRIEEVSLTTLDIESLLTLSSELEREKVTLQELGRQMKELGIPFPAV